MFLTKIIDHGNRSGDVMQALAQWRHPVASNEAQDVLHRAMRPALHSLYQHGNQKQELLTCILLLSSILLLPTI
jgi:hypothetical protein